MVFSLKVRNDEPTSNERDGGGGLCFCSKVSVCSDGGDGDGDGGDDDGAGWHGNHRGWILNNLNASHLDYYYVFFAILNLLNFIFFLFVSKFYVYKAEVSDSLAVLRQELEIGSKHRVTNSQEASTNTQLGSVLYWLWLGSSKNAAAPVSDPPKMHPHPIRLHHQRNERNAFNDVNTVVVSVAVDTTQQNSPSPSPPSRERVVRP
ncbi:hypothetical protein FXO37_20987 [Capsicum annuum]|nr:hypothetical protein FXO37_20987 [Capsicum annuum]